MWRVEIVWEPAETRFLRLWGRAQRRRQGTEYEDLVHGEEEERDGGGAHLGGDHLHDHREENCEPEEDFNLAKSRGPSLHYGNIFEYLSLWSEVQFLEIQK